KELGTIRPSEAHLELASPWIFEDVNPEAPVVPARIKGRIAFPAGKGSASTLAIAINDVIRATTTSHDGGKDVQEFSAMVSPASFKKGQNAVTVYLAEGSRGRPLLTVVEDRRPLNYVLGGKNNEELITSSEGRSYRIIKDKLD